MGNAGHADFGITHRRRGVAVHTAKIALAVNQHVAQGKGLRHPHHRVVDGGIAVRVIFTDGVADYAGGFFIRFIPVVAQLAHGEQGAPMHRLKAIAHIRQRPPDDHAHRVIEVGLAHLVFQVDR